MAKKPAAAPEIPEEIRKLSFEEAMEALEGIVGKLESGDVGLENSIEIYTRGTLLKRHCEEKLRTASEKVERIVIGPTGEAAGTESAETD